MRTNLVPFSTNHGQAVHIAATAVAMLERASMTESLTRVKLVSGAEVVVYGDLAAVAERFKLAGEAVR